MEKIMNKSLNKLVLTMGLAGGMLFAAVGVNAGGPSEWAKADYMNYCSACHGADGTGSGPVSSELKGKPSDLTVLAKNNGGNFPYAKVYRTIDGTSDTWSLRAHGSKEMPVWGDVFSRKAASQNTYMETKGKIMAIMQYIVSLQKE